MGKFLPTSVKSRGPTATTTTRITAPRLVAQAEKNAQQAAVRNLTTHTTTIVTSSNRGATKVITTTATQTFAAKLTEASTSQIVVSVSQGMYCKI